MIIVRNLMLQLVLTAEFKRQFLQWDVSMVPIKEPSCLWGKTDLSKRKICKVVILTAEPASAREATERLLKILNSTYAKAYLKQVSYNTTHINT